MAPSACWKLFSRLAAPIPDVSPRSTGADCSAGTVFPGETQNAAKPLPGLPSPKMKGQRALKGGGGGVAEACRPGGFFEHWQWSPGDLCLPIAGMAHVRLLTEQRAAGLCKHWPMGLPVVKVSGRVVQYCPRS